MPEDLEDTKENERTWYDNLAITALTVVASALSTIFVEKTYKSVIISRRNK